MQVISSNDRVVALKLVAHATIQICIQTLLYNAHSQRCLKLIVAVIEELFCYAYGRILNNER